MFTRFPTELCSIEDLADKIKQNGSPFIDPLFPPCDDSLFEHEKSGFDTVVNWRRPQDFVNPSPESGLIEPVLFPPKSQTLSFVKGELNDDWILSAI